MNSAADGGGAGEGTGVRAGARAPRARAATAVPAPLVSSLRERSLRQLLWIEDEAPPQRLIALQAAARVRSPLDPASLPEELVRTMENSGIRCAHEIIGSVVAALVPQLSFSLLPHPPSFGSLRGAHFSPPHARIPSCRLPPARSVVL